MSSMQFLDIVHECITFDEPTLGVLFLLFSSLVSSLALFTFFSLSCRSKSFFS